MSDSCDPVNCSLPGSSVHGILQARMLEWVVISLSRGTSRSRNWAQVSRIAGGCSTYWAMWDIFRWRHTHIQQIDLLSVWHGDYLLFLKWKWIIIKVFFLIIFTLSMLRKRRVWSCCFWDGRCGGGGTVGRKTGIFSVILCKYIIISVWILLFHLYKNDWVFE